MTLKLHSSIQYYSNILFWPFCIQSLCTLTLFYLSRCWLSRDKGKMRSVEHRPNVWKGEEFIFLCFMSKHRHAFYRFDIANDLIDVWEREIAEIEWNFASHMRPSRFKYQHLYIILVYNRKWVVNGMSSETYLSLILDKTCHGGAPFKDREALIIWNCSQQMWLELEYLTLIQNPQPIEKSK